MVDLNSKIDDFVARTRQKNGRTVRERRAWNTSAGADAIRHFAFGIGDDNPLWLDEAHAARGPYGALAAPPAFLTSVEYPFVHGAGTDAPLPSLIGALAFHWQRPIYVDDNLRATLRQQDVLDKVDIDGRRTIFILSEASYFNGDEQLIAVASGTMVRKMPVAAERPAAPSIQRYDEAQLSELHEALLNQARSGAGSPDVNRLHEGFKLPVFVQAPFTIGDMVNWQTAIGPGYRAGAPGYRDLLSSPSGTTLIDEIGWPVHVSQQHEDWNIAHKRGMAGPFDNGVMRFARMSVMFTNWMGDQGFLRRLRIDLHRPILYGDASWTTSEIQSISVENNDRTATLSFAGRNQRGEVHTTGEAEIFWPGDLGFFGRARRVASTAAVPSAVKPMPDSPLVHERIAQSAAAAPHKKAILFQEQWLTFEELEQQANQLAHYLRDLGVGPEVVVALCLERSPAMIVAMLGVLKAGGAFLPLDPAYPREWLSTLLEDARCAAILAHSGMCDNLPPASAPVIFLDRVVDELAGRVPMAPPDQAQADHLAYILYTSGTTARPKGVEVAHGALALYIQVLNREMNIGVDDIYLCSASFSFSAAMRQIFLPLCQGATLILASDPERTDPLLLFELIKSRRVTVWDTVPSIWRNANHRLLALGTGEREALLDNDLRLICSTGEPLTWSIVHDWQRTLGHGAQLVNLYAQTETCGVVCVYPIEPDTAQRDGFVPLGRPLEQSPVYLLDEDLRHVADGHPGEIFVGGARIARGYRHQAQLSGERFVPDPFAESPQAIMFRTGDRARRMADGAYEGLGRGDKLLKIRGFRVEPHLVEDALREHPAVLDAVVIGIADAQLSEEQQLVALVVPRQEPLEVRELRSYLAGRLPEYMIPTHITTVSEFPLTNHGKIDQAAMRNIANGRPTPAIKSTVAASDFEQRMLAIWRQVFDLPEMGVEDDFFEAGGHSLLAVRLLIEMESSLDVRPTLMTLMNASTVRQLSQELAKTDRTTAQ